MSFDIQFSNRFKKSAKKLAKKYPSLKHDLEKLGKQLSNNPNLGTPLGKNLYKIRISITGKKRGKSGGARVITCVIFKSKTVLLADIYDKKRFDTIDENQILQNLIQEGFGL
ncbi:addiction module toxin RelE [Membranihabitans maritimus]|uniref:addiction module toxin RelE n=1 Tax=Membranihabitans maritimus TaxID=2904244 RepID=UPI001F1F8088|nr:addiction module toxin RelE [Membranihabitans maritimus]